MSEYKIRTQRRSKQSYAPYHTKKKELSIVSRMWGWLDPSSWWPGATGEPSPPSPPPVPSPHPPSLSHDHSVSDTGAAATASAELSVLVTEPCAPLLDPRPDMKQGPCQANGMGPDNESSSSWIAEDEEGSTTNKTSWTGPQTGLSGAKTGQSGSSVYPGPEEHNVQRVENPVLGTVPNHAHSPSVLHSRMKPGSEFTSRVLRTRPLSTSTPQLSPVNESDEQGPPRHGEKAALCHRGNCDSHHGSRLSHRGNRVGSQLTHDSSKLASIPEQSPFHSTQSMLRTTPSVSVATATISQHVTDLSLSRSPFQSPFYSGRTSFGGAASRQRLRTVKRPRTESSPPVSAPVQMTVTARPRPSAPPPSLPPLSLPLSSSTARKILLALDSLSSPLADARKLPLRGAMEADRQPAHKRHKSAHMTLSPPPIVPLSTPTLNPSLSTPHPSRDGPVIVPNEKSLRRRRPASRQSSLLAATLRPEKQPVSLTYTSTSASTNTGSMVERSPQMSGSGQSPSQWAKPPSFSPELPPSGPAASRLSSVTFSPPPLPSHSMSPDRSKQPSLSPAVKPVHNFTPTFHASSLSPPATSGGKVRLPRSSRTHHSHHHDNDEQIPVAMIPQPLKPASSTSVVSQATETLPNYSFSTPKAITSESLTEAPSKKLSSSFQFSAPKLCTPQQEATPTHWLTSPTHKQTPPPEQEAPPLKALSVVDILKRPDYQALTTAKQPLLSISPAQPVVDLTDDGQSRESGVEKERETASKTLASLSSSGFKLPPLPSVGVLPPESLLQPSAPPLSLQPSPTAVSLPTSSSLKPLTGFSVPMGGWECGTCLVLNKANDERCVACGASKPTKPAASQLAEQDKPEPTPLSASAAMPRLAPLPQFAAAKDSWECGVCLVRNKATDSKCVACATPKPGGVATENSGARDTAPQPAMKFAAQGGLHLGSGGLQLGKADPLSGEKEVGKSAPPGKKQDVANPAPQMTTPLPPLKPLFQFAPPEGSWSCETCMVDNKKADSKCIACGTSRPGSADSITDKQAPPMAAPMMFGAGVGLKLTGGQKLGMGIQGGVGLCGGSGLKVGGGGLQFGSGGLKLGSEGLMIGAPSQNSEKKGTKPELPRPLPALGGQPVGGWECSTCLVHNKPDASACVACGGTKPVEQVNLVSKTSVSRASFTSQTKNNSFGSSAGTGMGFPSLGSGSSAGMGLKLTGGLQVPGAVKMGAQPVNPLAGVRFGSPSTASLAPSAVCQSSLQGSPAKLGPTSFTFSGTTSGTRPVFPVAGGLGATSTTSSSVFTSAPTLTFGATQPPSNPQPVSSCFQFGTAASQPVTSSTTSQPPRQALFQFGQSGQINSTGFTFAATTTGQTSNSTFTFSGADQGAGQTSNTSSSAFTFSGANSGIGNTSSSTFTFSGANPSTGQTSHTGFGVTETSSGASSTTAQSSQTGFNFGTARNGAPSFNFGSGQTSSAGFNFSASNSGLTGQTAPMFPAPAAGQSVRMFTGGVATASTTTGRVIRHARRRKA